MTRIFPLAYYHHEGLFGGVMHGAAWGFGSSIGHAVGRVFGPMMLLLIGAVLLMIWFARR